MRIKTVYPILLVMIIGLASCQKEVSYADPGGSNGTNPPGGGPNPQPGNNKPIEGNWKFVRMLLALNSTLEMPVSGVSSKMIMSMSGQSAGEGGTLKIDASTMKTDGITYSFNTTGTVQMFAAGFPVGSEPLPIDIMQPPAGTEVTYTRIGTDSIRTSAPLVNISIEGFEDFEMPIGGRISWLGDTLVLTSLINQQQTDNSTGVAIKVSAQGKQTIKFVKQ